MRRESDDRIRYTPSPSGVYDSMVKSLTELYASGAGMTDESFKNNAG